MPYLRCVATLVGLFVMTGLAGAQTENSLHTLKANGAPSPKAKISEMAWIEGHWVGEVMGGPVEEIWTAPQAGSMMGSFRWIRDGKVALMEICTLAEENESLILRIKHLSLDLKSREKQDECTKFTLVKLTSDAVYFDGLTFKKEKNADMTVWVVSSAVMKNEN